MAVSVTVGVGVDRQPLRPLGVEERRDPTREPMPPSDDLARLDLNPAGLDDVDAHLPLPHS
jgi:hypothetical protein